MLLPSSIRDSVVPGNERIYRYVVAYDGGTAPRPFDGLCSLAICKPKIRATAEVDDWIIGFRSRRPGEVLYAMQVTERLSLGDYWEDHRFHSRRPGNIHRPDNIYRSTADGVLEQVPNEVHAAEHAARDRGGKNVLLSNCFWYFGNNSVPLPNELMHLVHTTQGHVLHKNRKPDDVAQLRRWLAAWPQGILGEPVDPPKFVGGGAATVASRMASEGTRSSRVCSRGTARQRRKPDEHVPGTEEKARSPRQSNPVRRIVLSRKGFDSSYGRIPSPILPDGRLLPLPIPAGHDRFTMGDLEVGDVDIEGLLRDLSNEGHTLLTSIHLDPDLNRRKDLRLPGWRPSLGQTGAAQAHLESQGVGVGDVFLFFGWFRQVEQDRGRWRYVRGSPHLHVLFGWLEVGDKLAVVSDRQGSLASHPWIADHPHVANPGHYDNPRNTLYVASERSRFNPSALGGGMFPRFSKSLQLTSPGESRTAWTLPEWFYPEGRTPLSYHGDPSRWERSVRRCQLRSVAKGQEFVLRADEYPESSAWLEDLVSANT